MKNSIPQDYAVRIKIIRQKLGLTQVRLANLMGVSFASVNRWENSQARPNSLAWKKIERVEEMGYHGLLDAPAVGRSEEGGRNSRSQGYDPAASWSQNSDDEKIFMAGLYFREMLLRGFIQRILIIAPESLLSTWERVMRQQFHLSFRILAGLESSNANPFKNVDGNLIIANLEMLADGDIFALLREPGVEPYDVAILDEYQSVSSPVGCQRSVEKTRRRQASEAFAGLPHGG